MPRLDKLDEPSGLGALKAEVMGRWGTIDLLDMLKDADHMTGLTEEFVSVANQERIPGEVLRRRLLLVLFALGTNMGIRQMVTTGEHGESEAALRHVPPLLRGTACAGRSPGWSPPRTRCATRPGGGRAPPAPRTPSASGPGGAT